MALNLYGETAADGNKMLYNVAHNLGSIYDLTEEATAKLGNFTEEWNSDIYWKRLGIIVGTNF